MGTRFWNCVGRSSQIHSDDESGTDFPQEQFTVGYVFQQCRSSSSLIAMVLFIPKLCGVHTPTAQLFVQPCSGVTPLETFERIRPRQLEMEPSADDDRMQVGSLKKGKVKSKGKHQPKPERKSHDQHDQHELYRHQHVQELWQNWTLGERLLETRWRSARQFHQ